MNNLVELKDTVNLMTSDSYIERFIAEYAQTKIRYNKLHNIIVKYDANTLDFQLSCPIEVLKMQKSAMGNYLNQLEIRAEIEHIDLSRVK